MNAKRYSIECKVTYGDSLSTEEWIGEHTVWLGTQGALESRKRNISWHTGSGEGVSFCLSYF
jgi:hypothetical protein